MLHLHQIIDSARHSAVYSAEQSRRSAASWQLCAAITQRSSCNVCCSLASSASKHQLILLQEIKRVLKPGHYFAGYEWCATDAYDPNNPIQKQVMSEIELGNGLPDIRYDCGLDSSMLCVCQPSRMDTKACRRTAVGRNMRYTLWDNSLPEKHTVCDIDVWIAKPRIMQDQPTDPPVSLL